jgi:hypothetical protein
MLVRPGNDRPFPQNDLAYLALRITAFQTFVRIEEAQDRVSHGDPAEAVHAYLEEVPLLAEVPLDIQVDLLAEVWMRHNASRIYRATLLDAAILYAACREGAEIIQELPSIVRDYLEDAPRQLDIRLDRWAVDRLRKIYPRWWRSFNPGQLQSMLDVEDFPSRLALPLEYALDRSEISRHLDRRFAGLLTAAELRDQSHLLQWTQQNRRNGERE